MSTHGPQPGAPAAETAADRAAEAFALVPAWMFGAPMAELFAAFGHELPTGPARDRSRAPAIQPTGDEQLPEWLTALLDSPDTEVAGLTRAQQDVLRRTLLVESLAAAEFNFRGRGAARYREYRERSQADPADYSAGLREQVLALADRLGLVTPQPPRYDRYGTTLILGGGYRSPLLRSRYAAKLQADGVDLGELGFLGSPRFLIEEPAERAVTDAYAPGAADEFDLMTAAAQHSFGVTPREPVFLCGCPSADEVCPAWSRGTGATADQTPTAQTPTAHTPAAQQSAAQTPAEYTHERLRGLADRDGRTVGTVLSASTGRPPFRPDTADTFALWARHFGPRPGLRVLVVTTQIFVPFQSFDATRRLYLAHGAQVDTVGFGAEWGDRPQTAEYLLQEVLSAIRSGRRLLVAAAEALTDGAGGAGGRA